MRSLSFMVVSVSLLLTHAAFAVEDPKNSMIEIGDYTPNGFVTSLRDAQSGQDITAQPVVVVRDTHQQIVQVTPIRPEDTDPSTPSGFSPKFAMYSLGMQYEMGINNFSVTLGEVFDVNGSSGMGHAAGLWSGILVEFEPGTRGVAASIGYSQGAIAGSFVGAYAIKGMYMKVWNSGSGLQAGDNLLGIQGDLKLYLVKASLGVFQKLDEVFGKDLRISFGLGVGI